MPTFEPPKRLGSKLDYFRKTEIGYVREQASPVLSLAEQSAYGAVTLYIGRQKYKALLKPLGRTDLPIVKAPWWHTFGMLSRCTDDNPLPAARGLSRSVRCEFSPEPRPTLQQTHTRGSQQE
ncbi:hypothetical protein D9M68_590410 [compost metagenome]